MKAPSSRIAPGPSGLPLIGNLLAFRRDVLALALAASREFGDVVRFRLGPRTVHLLNHPDHVAHVLQRHHARYKRSDRSAAKIAMVCGESLLTTDGPVWARQRKLVQPALHAQEVAGFGAAIAAATRDMLDRWQRNGARPIALDAEMKRLAFDIATASLFGMGISAAAHTVAEAMDVLLEDTYRRIAQPIDLPLWMPTPANRRFRKARAALDDVVYRLIDKRRAEGGTPRDVLGRLLGATDDEGAAMTDTALRDQTITLLLSGHETTATALSWTFALLAEHAGVEARLQREVDERLGGREPSAADVQSLDIVTRVLNESMRLYPPIWILERYVLEDDEIGGYAIPRGSTVVICPYTLHRHPAFWQRPDAFDPDRFTTDGNGTAAGAFLPFGAGPHHCIGSHFAMLTTRIVLAMVAQRFRLRLAPGTRPAPKGGITLRANDRMIMTAEVRAAASQSL